jgi:hypothetical protein
LRKYYFKNGRLVKEDFIGGRGAQSRLCGAQAQADSL